MGKTGPFDLQRFIDAQETAYERVRAELRAGRKATDWIWFIFPQMKGLGYTAAADLYGLTNLDEARAYLAHTVLGPRLRECVRLLMAVPAPRPIGLIVGREDARKVRSSMTLFAAAAEDNAEFLAVLARYFNGDQDDRTLELVR